MPSIWAEARILVVDDDPNNLRLARRLLEHGGYQRVAVTDRSEEALSAIREDGVDLVVLDVHMPGPSGLEILAAMGDGSERYLPVLVVTADTTEATRREALGHGATDYITRPYGQDEFLLRVGNLVKTRRLHRELASSNQDLEAKVQARTEELERAHSEMLMRLALAAEFRDDQTGEHTWRVGWVAGRIAAKLGETARQAKLIERAARLHDVGKIGIPDAILLKPGRLDRDEYAIMQRHTTIGANLLSGGTSQVLQLAERIALSHHERWDGTGYPRRLGEDDIPYEGRMVAVADVYDALVHQRTYKATWSHEEAVAEIRRQRGSQFEPRAVDAFLELADEGVLEDMERPDETRFRGSLPAKVVSDLPAEG